MPGVVLPGLRRAFFCARRYWKVTCRMAANLADLLPYLPGAVIRSSQKLNDPNGLPASLVWHAN